MSLKILFLASEALPFSKTGGLGDVAGALPAALAELGHEVDVVTPLYSAVRDARVRRLGVSLTLKFPYGAQRVELHEARAGERLRFLFIDHPASFKRPGLYGE